ncbi:MAG: hypothetical protein VCC20_09710 [Myxococcota bacterium]
MTNTWVITGVTENIITIPGRGTLQGVAFTLQPTPNEKAMTPSSQGGDASIAGGPAYENHAVTWRPELSCVTEAPPARGGSRGVLGSCSRRQGG